MSTVQLTDTQRQVLKHAARKTGGCITWFPDSVKGGARKKVLDGLLNRELVTTNGNDWFVSAKGYEALGGRRPKPVVADAELEAAVAGAEAAWPAKPRTRQDSKQAQVIAMLKRQQGATIAQICEATEWLPHTVRGTFAGAFKKKLGLDITSTKDAGAERVYRINA